MSTIFKVKYNFRAEDEGELSVSKAELLRLCVSSSQADDDDSSKDGWTLVETLQAPFAKGYVPTNYIVAVDDAAGKDFAGTDASASALASSSASSSASTSLRPRTAGSERSVDSGAGRRYGSGSGASLQSASLSQAQEQSPTRTSKAAPIRRLSDPRLPQHLLETLESADMSLHPGQLADLVREQEQQELQEASQAAQHQLGATSRSVQRRARADSGALAQLQQLAPVAGQAHVDLTKLFATHEGHYAQVVGEREQEFAAFEDSVDTVTKTMAQLQEKNQDVVTKVMQLEAQVQQQREKLKQRIHDDNQRMNSRFAQLYA